ncbi:hypothetical protein L6E12_19900 [Actinokineospora sp. PR83]|nr:hypothetical protein [Actinokineospora sp. PR83]MCG8918049.1 hypothetical protein [Actinokineospora sp. PR83]
MAGARLPVPVDEPARAGAARSPGAGGVDAGGSTATPVALVRERQGE